MSAHPDPVHLALPVGFVARRGPGARLWHLWRYKGRKPNERPNVALCGTRLFGGYDTVAGDIHRTCGRCAVLHASKKGDEHATTR